MKKSLYAGLFLLVVFATPSAAQKCPAVDIVMLNKGYSEVAPWRVTSGGPGQCSFSTRNSSVSFGFNHMVMKSTEAAIASANEMKQAVAGTSLVEPMESLGNSGFTYQPKQKNGQVDRTSMFFYGHRGTLNVSGYLNLKDAITPEQRILAANLLAQTLGVAFNPKALAKETNCRYFDANIVKRLLPGDDMATIVPDANNCVVSAGGKVITVSVSKDTRGWPTAERLLRDEGCTVDTVPNLGNGAAISHHCSKGNKRAEVQFIAGGRMFRVLFAPPAEPSAAERATLVELARVAARN